MDETQWDVREVKQLKKKQLVQSNIGMLLAFLLLIYISGQPYFLLVAFYILVLILIAIAFYNLKTGRFIGTRTSRRVQEFDKARLGEKRWKRRKIAEAVFGIILGAFITFFIFSIDFNNARLYFPSIAFPFIGAWVGHNIGEIVRMNNL